MSILQEKALVLARKIHFRIFGCEIGDEMQKFLGNLGVSFFGGTIYSLLLFSVSVFAGRLLGPVDYGKYAIFTVLFSFLMIFLSFGLETSIVRLASGADRDRKKKIISTFFIFFILNTVFWTLVVWIFRYQLTSFFELPIRFIFFALFFSIAASLGTAMENFLRVLDQFVFANVVRVFQGAFLLISILLVYFASRGFFSLEIYIVLNIVALFFSLAAFLFRVRHYLSPIFEREILKEFFLLSSIFFLGLVAGYLLQNGTVILVGKFIGQRELGIYSAYYTLSILATSQIITLFSSVYFPAVARATDKKAIVEKIRRVIFPLGLLWFVFNFLFMLFGIKLYGSAYPVDIVIILVFSLYAFFNLYGSLFGFITISGGEKSAIRNLYLFWLIAVIFYFALLLVIGFLGFFTLYVAVVAYATIFLVNALLNRHFCNKYLLSL